MVSSPICCVANLPESPLVKDLLRSPPNTWWYIRMCRVDDGNWVTCPVETDEWFCIDYRGRKMYKGWMVDDLKPMIHGKWVIDERYRDF